MSKKHYKSYKSLITNYNYFDSLSIDLLTTVWKMYELNDCYKHLEEKKFFERKNNKLILNLSLNELRGFLWTKFCNEMRDYSDLVFGITKKENKCIREEYKDIIEYIKNSTFISSFVAENKEYNALSLTLHNFNKFNYGAEKYNSSFDIYKLFNNKLINIDFNKIKIEFEEIIYLFRKIEDIQPCYINLYIGHAFPIIELIKLLT